jgi:AraC-like DNA-binding protein
VRLRINSAGKTRCPEGWSLTPERTRRWRDLDAWYLVDGSGRVEGPCGCIPIEPGDLLFMRGGCEYTFYRDSDIPFTHYWTHFDILDEAGTPTAPLDAPLPNFHIKMPHQELAGVMWERLIEACRPNRGRPVVWLAAILAESERAGYLSSGGESTRRKEIADVCRSIDSAPERRWSVSGLASDIGLSRTQFFRLFRRQTGLSPQHYVLEARMNQARSLLRESGLSIGEIAETLGYPDSHFFSRLFKRHHGKSPSRYRMS